MECSQQKRFLCCLTRGAVHLTFASVAVDCWPQPVSPDPPWTVLSLLLQEQWHWGRWWQLHSSLWSTIQVLVTSSHFPRCLCMFLCRRSTNVLWVTRLSRDYRQVWKRKGDAGMSLPCFKPTSSLFAAEPAEASGKSECFGATPAAPIVAQCFQFVSPSMPRPQQPPEGSRHLCLH